MERRIERLSLKQLQSKHVSFMYECEEGYGLLIAHTQPHFSLLPQPSVKTSAIISSYFSSSSFPLRYLNWMRKDRMSLVLFLRFDSWFWATECIVRPWNIINSGINTSSQVIWILPPSVSRNSGCSFQPAAAPVCPAEGEAADLLFQTGSILSANHSELFPDSMYWPRFILIMFPQLRLTHRKIYVPD